jgi:hypothetical protein
MATYVEIASVTVGSGGASSIAFSSIPSTYTDLKIVCSGRSSASSNSSQIFTIINSADGSSKVLRGSGSAASSFTDGSLMETGRAPAASSTSNTFGNGEWYIPNYSTAITHSVSSDVVSENNATEAYAELAASLSSNSLVISSVTLTFYGSGNFVEFSTAYLYGIKKD